MRTAIKINSSRDLSPLDYAIWDVLENKTEATPHPINGSLITAIAEDWKKMFKEFILIAYKSFRRRADTITEKIMAILSKFTILRLCSYFVYFFKLKSILFYNRAVYYYARIILIFY